MDNLRHHFEQTAHLVKRFRKARYKRVMRAAYRRSLLGWSAEAATEVDAPITGVVTLADMTPTTRTISAARLEHLIRSLAEARTAIAALEVECEAKAARILTLSQGVAL